MRSSLLRFLEVPEAHRAPTNDFETTVWIADPDIVFRLATVLGERGDKIAVGFRDDNGFYEKRTVNKSEVQTPSVSYYVEDMCNLSEMNDASVLNAVKCRYQSQLIHTYSGLFCLVVNPWKNLPIYTDEVMQSYMNGLDTDLPPHIYSVAQSAHDNLLSGSNQSILITGESGAGKTVNTKRIIEYLGVASEKRSGLSSVNRVDDRLTAAGIIIEAFANASTIHNSNSSRLGKFIRLDFGDDMILRGAQIESYLLEKSRVVKQNEGDRNFHIFYQLLSDGFDEDIRSAMGLVEKANAYNFLNQGGKTVDPEIDDQQGIIDTLHSMDVIKFTTDEVREIFETVSACILLGEIRFSERSGLDITYVDGRKEVEAACRMLRVKKNDLVDALTQPSMKVNDVVIKKSQNLIKTRNSLCALCKTIYERLFKWILSRCNDSLCETFHPSKSSRTYYIGVLDIAGFEIITKNSFEQFCINYTNEKLQQFFNDFMFIREQQEYLSEGISWKRADYGTDMQDTIELIEKPLGMLSLLQEECLLPNGNDVALLDKLLKNHSGNTAFARTRQSVRRTVVSHFSVLHYAGKVQYNIDGWVEKNKDAVERNCLEVLSTSSKTIMKALFPHSTQETGRSRRQSFCCSTVSYVYKEQLFKLLQTLNSTTAHFIRCISPNHKRLPGIIDPHLVLHQLRCNGVLEGIRICRQGYPNRLPFNEFVARYRVLVAGGTFAKDREGAYELCQAINLDETNVQIGKTRVYCKVGIISDLENRRRTRLCALVCGLQAAARWYLQQKEMEQRMLEREAIIKIQKNVRRHVEKISWPWYKLYLLVKDLIPLQQDRIRVQELENENNDLVKELSSLQEKNERLERLLDEAESMITKLTNEKELYAKERDDMKEEMVRHEQLLELMEKRFDEQHSKVMKIHSCLRENVKKMEILEDEKKEVERKMCKLKQNYEKEYEQRRAQEHNLEIMEQTVKEMELKMELVEKKREKETSKMDDIREEMEKLKKQSVNQNETITEFQRCIIELNDKCAYWENALNAEKKARKKAEVEKAENDCELKRLNESVQKSNAKIEQLKVACREKERIAGKLQAKLDETAAKSEMNIAEMKKIHKQSKDELQSRLEELKKTCQRLESENRAQKIKLDYSEKDRESSVESDYVSGGRQSRLGSRQYSSSSFGSLSSFRTLSRRTAEPECKFSSGYRSPSTYSVSDSYSYLSNTSPLQIANERKISQLERQIVSAHTDTQMLKREIEVYKTTLVENEKERDSLSQKIRSLNATMKELEQSLIDEENKNHEQELRLKKTQNELENMRNKHEQAVKDGQTELLEEKRKNRMKMDALLRENASKKSDRKETRAMEELQTELAEVTAQLNRSLAQIAHLESANKTKDIYGDTWEHQYRLAMAELEELRDENASLKTKIRRQYREIELLKHQSEMEADVALLESKMGLSESNNQGKNIEDQ